MMDRRIPVPFALVMIVALAGLVACGTTGPTTFYMLSPMADPESSRPVSEDDDGPTLGIGPVEIAGYLDRPQIVSRASQNKLELAEFDKWAEPLDRNIERVLAQNLSMLLGTERIIVRPWGPLPVTHRVGVRVLRLDATQDGVVNLVARWAIIQERGRRMLVIRTSRHNEPMTEQEFQGTQATLSRDYTGVAAAMSRMLLRVSEEIAVEIKRLEGVGGTGPESADRSGVRAQKQDAKGK